MTIDPRLADRRREVAEHKAQRNLRRLLRFLAALLVAGGVVWFLLSPWMSADRVRVAGVVASETELLLVRLGVVVGRPLVLIRAGVVETALEADPWVISADVDLDWPSDVVVRVVERTPRAWVETADGWTRRAEDGGAVPSAPEPDNTLGWVRMPHVPETEAATSEVVLGAIEFIHALPSDLARVTAVRFEEGELWAVVDGHQVRLGRETEMTAKAVSLVTLLTEDIPDGATLILVAPTHPAVAPGPGEVTE
ncbi:MAG: FtsQ-type POTRA domain-containing protein [Actinobacteria bacterium]|nr:FtsQ-type POTRA domain-containing protein [Actinomycetota bacterium]MCI0543411.1 FtsQ-type POTRA domain-containing protein [Actinomycetota bacterium]